MVVCHLHRYFCVQIVYSRWRERSLCFVLASPGVSPVQSGTVVQFPSIYLVPGGARGLSLHLTNSAGLQWAGSTCS